MQTGKFGSVSSIKKESYYRDYQNYQYQNQNQRGEGRSSKRGSGVIERMLWWDCQMIWISISFLVYLFLGWIFDIAIKNIKYHS